tara:strand:- start:11340 stop:13586 length:2247 start_codon:yes stop_codon:yes gene_type:complete
MATTLEKPYNTFVKGLITEASPLTFPDNASVDEQNFVLNRDGSRSRRLGVDYENLHAEKATGLSATQLSSGRQDFFKWDSPAGDKTVTIGVVRANNKLWFINLLTSNPSNNFLNSGNPITLSGVSNGKLETAIINNKLIIVGSELSQPVLLSYNKTTKAVSQATIDVYVRDIWGVDDGLTISERPTSLSETHKYNLRNQGWNSTIVTSTGADALDYTFSELGLYPSNGDTWTFGKISNAADADYEKYDPDTLIKNSTSQYFVSRGSNVIDAFTRGAQRSALTGLSLPNDLEQGNITTAASYAQRVFYSGVSSDVTGSDSKSPNYSGYIFFTQVVTTDDQLGKCHQKADPTDPGINALVASDGGTIQIPEATQIVKIVSSQQSLLVFAENGVWEIYGDTGGFNANSFQLNKISTNGISNGNSVVNVGGNFIYWSKAGIYDLSPDSVSGRFKALSMSLGSIQSFFIDIPDLGKNNCKGFYDEKENRVRWLYNDTDDYSETNYITKFNKELVLDLSLKAWYPQKFSDLASNSPWVSDYIEIPGYAVSSTAANVEVAAGDAVIVTAGTNVVANQDIQTNRTSGFRFLTFRATSFTVSLYKSTEFKDWKTADSTGVDYSSYLVTGYELFKDSTKRKQVPYIFFYFDKTEDGYTAVGSDFVLNNQSSCLVQAQWNWANSAAGGKWGTQFQAYRLTRLYIPTGASDSHDTGQGVITTKSKLRGSGKTLSLKIQSEAGKDMKLLGWTVQATALTKA